MKLLYIMNKINGRGGLNRIAFDKINYLINEYEIEVIFYGSHDIQPFYEVDKRVRFHNIDIDALASFSKKFKNTYHVFTKYKHLLEIIKPDIIINMNTNILSWIIPFCHKQTPKIIELHQSYDGVRIFNEKAYGKNNWKSKFSIFLRNMIYPLYDKVIVLTHTDMKKWGYKNTDVIPNFTNIQQATKVNVESHKFIWIGRLSHQKGIDLLLQIWEDFLKKESDWSLILIGNSSEPNNPIKKQLINYITCNKNNKIEYIEETSEIMKYYNNASIYLSTSRYEGLPLCLVEAATMGKPIIGFDITGNDEVIENNVNGVLIQPYEIKSYITAMEELSTDQLKRTMFGKSSIEKSKVFNKKEIMTKWTTLFNNLIFQR